MSGSHAERRNHGDARVDDVHEAPARYRLVVDSIHALANSLYHVMHKGTVCENRQHACCVTTGS